MEQNKKAAIIITTHQPGIKTSHDVSAGAQRKPEKKRKMGHFRRFRVEDDLISPSLQKPFQRKSDTWYLYIVPRVLCVRSSETPAAPLSLG